MLEHRRRPHAYDTYTGGVPSLSSLFKWNLPDFVVKDESGNALLASWLHSVSRRNGPQDTAKIMQMSDMTKKSCEFFSFPCPSAALWVPFPITKRGIATFLLWRMGCIRRILFTFADGSQYKRENMAREERNMIGYVVSLVSEFALRFSIRPRPLLRPKKNVLLKSETGTRGRDGLPCPLSLVLKYYVNPIYD